MNRVHKQTLDRKTKSLHNQIRDSLVQAFSTVLLSKKDTQTR